MKESLDIIQAFGRAKRRGERCVLASVVRVQGSTYRRPGARALFLPGGEIIGLIGGGCLESDLSLRAAEVRETDRTELVRYDNTSVDDIVWGLGLGCNGIVEILLEAIDAEHPGPLDWIARCLEERTSKVLATVIRSNSASLLASRCLIAGARIVEQTANWDVSIDLAFHANEVAVKRKPKIVDIGKLEILVEPLEPPIRLVVVGAGPDAVPLLAFGARLGWLAEVFDHRESFARAERFPEATSVHNAPIAEIARIAKADPRTAVVLMTHHFLNDRELVRGFLESRAAYCGVLGPKARLKQLLEVLEQEGYVPSAERLQSLKGPVGLDIGAETPEEIALSICAEIQAFFAGYDGAPLTRKAGPIHD